MSPVGKGFAPRVLLTTREKILLHCRWDRTGCWKWVGHLNQNGYAVVAVRGRDAQLAHRVAYEAFISPIPEGHELDHLCTTKDCVNPMHVEPVLRPEHQERTTARRRKTRSDAPSTHCRNGHPRSAHTVQIGGELMCRACRRAATRRYNERRKAAA